MYESSSFFSTCILERMIQECEQLIEKRLKSADPSKQNSPRETAVDPREKRECLPCCCCAVQDPMQCPTAAKPTPLCRLRRQADADEHRGKGDPCS